MYQGGYTGKILRFRHTDQIANEKELPHRIVKDFIGDAGFGIKDFFDELRAGTGPLDSDSVFRFSSGPSVAITIQCSSRMAGIVKLPLTDTTGTLFQADTPPSGCDMRAMIFEEPKPEDFTMSGQPRVRTPIGFMPFRRFTAARMTHKVGS
jgi:hypothetical protein